ncbi:MAG: FRG domain-containing protein [Anaerolineales bacterium]|nr:FRG domain-containing protein [Anaerolineales bacterium]
MDTISVTSWNELQDRLFEGAWMPDLHLYRSQFAFRGLSRADYPLETSLFRLCKGHADLERHLLRNFRKYAHRDIVEQDSLWYWLSVAQHHGLPTRLMDWTFSPYVAMHFATARTEKFDVDGAIWAVNYKRVHEALPNSLLQLLNREGSDVFTVDMLTEKVDALDEFDALAEEDFVLFFEPPSIDDRIVNQFALFSVVSDPLTPLDSWLENHPDVYRKIIIPSGLKWEIRDKLDQANITERVLFPGLDGLSSWMKRQYTPRSR